MAQLLSKLDKALIYPYERNFYSNLYFFKADFVRFYQHNSH